MKKLIPAVLMSLLFVVACKKDDDKKDEGTKATSKMTYNSNDYLTPNGFLEIYRVEPGATYIDRDVVFTDLSKTQYNGNFSFNNKSVVLLDLNSSLNTTELEVGTYTFSDTRAPMTIVFADAFGNVSYDTETEELDLNTNGFISESFGTEITSGSVTVTKSGDDFVFVYSVNFEDKVVSGLYSGSLEVTFNENDSTNFVHPNSELLVKKNLK